MPCQITYTGSVDGSMDVVGLSFCLAQQAFDGKKKDLGLPWWSSG